jgi:hypothetical protein
MIKLSLCLKWAPCHEGLLEDWRYSSTDSLILSLDGGELSASSPNHFTPRERAPGTHFIGDPVSPRASLDVVARKGIPSPCQDSNPQSSRP